MRIILRSFCPKQFEKNKGNLPEMELLGWIIFVLQQNLFFSFAMRKKEEVSRVYEATVLS